MRHWLMTAALLLCSMVVSAEDFSVDGIYYNITSETDLTVEVTSAIDEYSGDVTIPAIVKHDGKTFRVTTIGMYAFYGCANLTSVVIPSSVTTINDQYNSYYGYFYSDLDGWINGRFGNFR